MKLAITAGLLSLFSAALASCSNVCACELVVTRATVSGRLTDATGTPVANAVVSAFTHDAPGCRKGTFDGSATSAADGTYLLILYQEMEQDSVCVFTFAQPNDGLGGLDGSDTLLVILGFRETIPQDSANVDFIMPVESHP